MPADEAFPERAALPLWLPGGVSVFPPTPRGSWWPKCGRAGGSALSLSALPSSAPHTPCFPSLLQKLGPLGKRASRSGLGQVHPSKSRSPQLGHVRLGLGPTGSWACGRIAWAGGSLPQASPQGLCTSHSRCRVPSLPSAFLSPPSSLCPGVTCSMRPP